ncbi:MAG TPA: choice-of-anchor D domain-containing protein, partial [Acidobacteriaceae bacterium]
LSKTCGTSLAAGASCTFSVAYKPTIAGAATAALTATDNAGNSPQSATLSGSTSSGSTITGAFSPTSLTFPATAVGATSAGQTLTFKNTGTGAMTVSSYAFTGANASQFTLLSKTCGTSLAAGASCTFSVAYKPTVAGAATAALKATDNATNSPQSATLSGSTSGGSTITGAFTPTSLTFPSTAVGATSAGQTLTFKNTGTAAMTVSSYTFTGTNASEFTVVSKTCGTSLAAGASCTFSIAFKPTITGSATAALKATDNATNSPQSAALAGTGH